jgi:hypothetical protein
MAGPPNAVTRDPGRAAHPDIWAPRRSSRALARIAFEAAGVRGGVAREPFQEAAPW